MPILNSDEVALIRIILDPQNSTVLNIFVCEVGSKYTSEHLSFLFSHLCYENKSMTEAVIQGFSEMITQTDFVEPHLHKVTTILTEVAALEDSLQDLRGDMLYTTIWHGAFDSFHKKYIKYSDSTLNLLLRVVSVNEKCRELLAENGEENRQAIKVFSRKHPKVPLKA